MALDPSIILGVKPYQQDDPLERFSKLASLENARGAQEIQRMQIAEGQRKVADEAATREAFKGGGTESEIYNRLLAGGHHQAAMAYQKNVQEGRAREAQTTLHGAQGEKAKWETQRDQLAHGAALLGTVRDGASFSAALETGLARGFWTLEQARQMLQPGYSPEHVQRLMAGGMTQAQTLDEQGKAATRAETGRHNVATERTAQGQLGVAQGNLGVARERLNQDKTQIVTDEAGNVTIVNKTTGQARPALDASGNPLRGNEKPMTESQSKALLFSNRMAEAEKVISDLSKSGTNVGVPGSRGPISAALNAISPEAQQSLNQAKRNFINAVLRRESGALISPEEIADADKQYFPQIGESKKIIDQKAANRRTALAGIQAEVPTGRRPKQEAAPAGQETRQVGGKSYVKVNGQWFEQ